MMKKDTTKKQNKKSKAEEITFDKEIEAIVEKVKTFQKLHIFWHSDIKLLTKSNKILLVSVDNVPIFKFLRKKFDDRKEVLF